MFIALIITNTNIIKYLAIISFIFFKKKIYKIIYLD